MCLIKLDTVSSTNDFLKSLSANEKLRDFTTVITNFQTKGRGISKTHWYSEPGKNMLCSIYFKPKDIVAKDQFFITMQTSLMLKELLATMVKEPIYIKWPNDIIISGCKIAGILQENVISEGKIKEVILGIGININQTDFTGHQNKAASISNLTGEQHNIENLALKLRDLLKERFASKQTNWHSIKANYEKQLLKFQEPQIFKEVKHDTWFSGVIQGVTDFGLLKLKIKDEVRYFDLKEIKMEY